MEETLELGQENQIESTELAEAQPLTREEQLTALTQKRTGTFPVRISYDTLKYLKNKLQQKVEWKGPNEAYLMIMAVLTVDGILNDLDPKKTEPTQVQMPASTIESVNYFLNRITGTGIDSAQKLFSISMMLRPAIEAMKTIDGEISGLEKELKSENSELSSDK